MSASRSPTLGKALLLPTLVALALAALLFWPRSSRVAEARPPLTVPVALDELVPPTSSAAANAPSLGATPEGLKSLQPH